MADDQEFPEALKNRDSGNSRSGSRSRRALVLKDVFPPINSNPFVFEVDLRRRTVAPTKADMAVAAAVAAARQIITVVAPTSNNNMAMAIRPLNIRRMAALIIASITITIPTITNDDRQTSCPR